MGLFNKKSGNTRSTATTTVIAKGCHITGELKLSSDIQVDGMLEGKLTSDALLVVSASGRIKGDVYADRILVNGLIEGQCYANSIEILDNGKIDGTVYCDDMSIDKGGKFFGRTHPGQQEQVITSNKKANADSTAKIDTSTKNRTAEKAIS